jgi:hypothetical protein
MHFAQPDYQALVCPGAGPACSIRRLAQISQIICSVICANLRNLRTI